MEDNLKNNLTRGSTWLRGLIMLLFAFLYGVAELVVTAVAVFQFGATLITGAPNHRLLGFGQSLSTWMYQVILFFTFRSDDRPFPFGDWPEGPPAGPAAVVPEAAPEVPVPVRKEEPEAKKPADKQDEDAGFDDRGETESGV